MDSDRTGVILTRALAYDESRVVCGVHTASIVDAGRTLASAILAALQGSPQYRNDFATAQNEVESLRKSASHESPSCATERSLESSPFDSLSNHGLNSDESSKADESI